MFNDWQLGFIAEQEGDSPSSREGQIKYIKKRLKSNPELANDEEYQDQLFQEAGLDFEDLTEDEIDELENCLYE